MISQDFTPLPTDHSVPFSRAIDFYGEHNPNRRYATLIHPDGIRDPIHVSWREFSRAINRGAHILNPINDGPGSSIGTGNVIGIYAIAGTILYQSIVMAVMRTGNIPFPLSTRNTTEGAANLLEKTSCHLVIVGGPFFTHDGFAQIHREMETKSHPVLIIPLPHLEQLYPNLGNEDADDGFTRYPDIAPSSSGGLYLHSSGSTGLPKAIHLTEQLLSDQVNMPTVRDLLPTWVIGGFPLPSYHLMGLYGHVLMPLASGASTTHWMSTDAAPPVPTPGNTLVGYKAAKCNALLVVPSFLVAWSHDESTVDYLSTIDCIICGGGPLPADVGRRLASRGVPIVAAYGATEFGVPTWMRPHGRTAQEWNWAEFCDTISFRMIPQSDDDDPLYECVVWDNENYHVAVHNSIVEGKPAYSSSDLFVRHPTKPHLWKVIGRVDDQVTLAKGEKINSGPIQDVVLSSPLVKGAVLVGRAKDQPAILVEPVNGLQFNPSDEKKLSEFRNAIWPTIEVANQASPRFAKIFKELILVTSPNKPLPRTAKDSVSMKAAIALYSKEIHELYDTVEKAKGGDAPLPDRWYPEDLQVWLANVLKELVGRPVSLEKDVFEQGADSLTATILRNRIVGAIVRNENMALAQRSQHIDQNLLYTYPTILALAKRISTLVQASEFPEAEPVEHAVKELRTLIDRHSSTLPARPRLPVQPHVGPEIVLLTGSTGSLGSLLLSQMLVDERVEKIWTVNRATEEKSSEQRQRESFIDKGIDPELLKTHAHKLVFVEADLAAQHLGLNGVLYSDICASTTVIIHNAWNLDFNLSLSSFGPNIMGTRNLIDVALASPSPGHTRVFFTSSVGVVAGWRDNFIPVPEEPIHDPRVSIGNGYGEGKYVAEKILEEARLKANVSTTNLRLGQICGGENGFWSVTDWVPIIVASSVELGCLPDAAGNVSWIRMHDASQAILDVGLDRNGPFEQTLHICHPRPVSWTSIFEAISTAMIPVTGGNPLPLVPFSDWIDKLESRSVDDTERIPALKLLSFFRRVRGADRDLHTVDAGAEHRGAAGAPLLSTEKMQRVSKTVAEIPSLSAGDAHRWVEYWTRKGLFSKSKDPR